MQNNGPIVRLTWIGLDLLLIDEEPTKRVKVEDAPRTRRVFAKNINEIQTIKEILLNAKKWNSNN